MAASREVVLVSRRSLLALRQAEQVAAALRNQCGLAVRIVGMSTRGDETPGPLAEVGGKDLFLDRLRQSLLDGRADAAVHSLKDMPAATPPAAEFILAAVGFAEDARDVVVSRGGGRLRDLPPGSTVGTSGPRRAALLRRYFPALTAMPIRGNIHRRLEKLENGDCDALLLAAAGLKRMNLQQHIAEYLPPEQFVPASGQGLLGVECAAATRHYAANRQQADIFAAIGDAALMRRAVAERTFAAALGGDCHTPLAAHATLCSDGQISVRGFYATADGVFYDALAADTDAQQAGKTAADDILRQLAADGRR